MPGEHLQEKIFRMNLNRLKTILNGKVEPPPKHLTCSASPLRTPLVDTLWLVPIIEPLRSTLTPSGPVSLSFGKKKVNKKICTGVEPLARW